jgi:hypothetical protein
MLSNRTQINTRTTTALLFFIDISSLSFCCQKVNDVESFVNGLSSDQRRKEAQANLHVIFKIRD